MDVSEFDFDLPEDLIAQIPPGERGRSRLLVMSRAAGAIGHHHFEDLPRLLAPGDVLVVNDTQVFPARLLGRRLPGGGAAECLLIRPLAEASPSDVTWLSLVHPGQRLREGSRLEFDDASGATVLHGEVIGRHFHGRRSVRLRTADGTPVEAVIDRLGHIPLPPYIKRPDTADDRARYQTVYARARGSIAAPTAGLHFTPALLDALDRRGVVRASVTLHVGYGTFQPVRVEQVEAHRVEPERYEVAEQAAETITRAKRDGRRVIAVGTTTTRVLESLETDVDGTVRAARGETSMFIHPGHVFRLVDGLVTNFHLPRSSLLMLVSAFGGHARVMQAYREAIAKRYRFYSYGDAMAIL
jgi:S-adenosylmethionine:tRNA ribosyltransferase-isomerase